MGSLNLSQALRAAIQSSGKSANEIAQATGVPQTTISRFIRGKDMGIDRASKIAAYLGLWLAGGTTVVKVRLEPLKKRLSQTARVRITKSK